MSQVHIGVGRGDDRDHAGGGGGRPARRHRRARVIVAAVGTGSLLVASGCGSSSGSSSNNDTTSTLAHVQSGAVTISARDNSFVPQTATVTVGTKVTFRNDGRNDHNVLTITGPGPHVETADFKPKDTYEYVATAPGTYQYYCSIHGTSDKGMIGTLQVVPQ